MIVISFKRMESYVSNDGRNIKINAVDGKLQEN